MRLASKFAKVTTTAVIEIVALTVLAADTNYELKPINLPSATGAVALDYFAYDRATGKLWVPASNTGSVDVIDEQTDANNYTRSGPIETASGARTGLFVPELDTLFVAVPQRGSRSAEIRVYHVE